MHMRCVCNGMRKVKTEWKSVDNALKHVECVRKNVEISQGNEVR
jgi:hypothetical protein